MIQEPKRMRKLETPSMTKMSVIKTRKKVSRMIKTKMTKMKVKRMKRMDQTISRINRPKGARNARSRIGLLTNSNSPKTPIWTLSQFNLKQISKP